MLTTGWETSASNPSDEPVVNPMEPLIVLPTQLASRSTERSGPKRLMAAVLVDAMHVYLKFHPGPEGMGGSLFTDAERWIESRERGWLLAFENVCEVLGIDASRLRQALHTLAATGGRRSVALDACRPRVSRGRKIRV